MPEVILVKKGESNDLDSALFLTCSFKNISSIISFIPLLVYKKPTGRRTFKLKSLDAEMEGLAPQRVSICFECVWRAFCTEVTQPK